MRLTTDRGPRVRAHFSGAHSQIRVTFLFTSLVVGGAEQIGSQLIARLNRRRFQPSVVCLKQLGALGERLVQTGSVPITHGLKRHRFDPTVAHRLSDTLRALRPDVLCMFGSGGDRSFWGRLAACWTSVPVRVCCPHAMGRYEPWEPYNRLLNAVTDAFVAISRKHREYLVNEAHLPASKITVIENGVDLELFQPGPPSGLLGLRSERPRVGLVAVLRPEKDVTTWLHTIRLLVDRGVEAEYLVVGDGPERRQLERLARELGIAHAVRFVGMQQDMPAVYRDLDICVLTSRGEVLPCTLMEAMACGKPVVATRVGAVEDLVSHGQTGLLAEPGNVEQLADAVARLVTDTTTREAMGQAARRHIEQNFGLDRMVQKFEALFESLLKRKAVT